MVRNMIHIYGEEVLAPRPTPKQEDHPLSTVRGCLFNIFAATLHVGGTAVAQWLRCCATNRKVAGSIPAGVGIFH